MGGWGGVGGGKDGVGVPLFVSFSVVGKGGPWDAATSKMELFVITVNGYRPLTIFIKGSILDVAGVLDPPRVGCFKDLVVLQR